MLRLKNCGWLSVSWDGKSHGLILADRYSRSHIEWPNLVILLDMRFSLSRIAENQSHQMHNPQVVRTVSFGFDSSPVMPTTHVFPHILCLSWHHVLARLALGFFAYLDHGWSLPHGTWQHYADTEPKGLPALMRSDQSLDIGMITDDGSAWNREEKGTENYARILLNETAEHLVVVWGLSESCSTISVD